MELPWVIVIIIVVVAFIGSNLMLLKHGAHLPMKKHKTDEYPAQKKPKSSTEQDHKESK